MIILSLVLVACAPWASPDPSLAHAPADTLVDVGDYGLHVEVIRGERPIAYVFESGGGAELSSWESVPDSVAVRTGATVVTYDRAGFGESELGPDDLTPTSRSKICARRWTTWESRGPACWSGTRTAASWSCTTPRAIPRRSRASSSSTR